MLWLLMPLPTLPELPALHTNMIYTGPPQGGGGTGGGGFPPVNPVQVGINLGGILGGGGSSGGSVIPAGFQPTSAALAAEGCSWYDIICLGKSQLTRGLLLILGIICIIGAIYLYKPTNTVVAPIVKGAHKLGKHIAAAAAEGAEAA